MLRSLALITGGTSGIGLAIAKKLIAEIDLAIVYSSNDTLAKESQRQLLALNSEAKVILVKESLNGLGGCQRAYQTIISEAGRGPEILVYCSGHFEPVFFVASDFSNSMKMLDEHLVAPMAMCYLLLPDMYRNRRGKIILLGSKAAHYPDEGRAAYSAAKGALESFSRALSREVFHRGITVNCVAPGLTETPMAHAMIKKIQDKNPDFVPGKPEDVAVLVKFLCSENAEALSGETFFVDSSH